MGCGVLFLFFLNTLKGKLLELSDFSDFLGFFKVIKYQQVTLTLNDSTTVLPFALPICIYQIFGVFGHQARPSGLTVHKSFIEKIHLWPSIFFLCCDSSDPPLHVYDSGWHKPHGPLCFLNSLIGIRNIPIATTCLTFPSQSCWADEGNSAPSETIRLFCRQAPNERGSVYHRRAQHLPHTYL